MKALITGASSGIGRDMARVLSEMGYDIIAVARRRERLEELKAELSGNVEVITADVTSIDDCKTIAERADEVDIFINNAGFGVFGKFNETSLDDELKMIETNLVALHTLTKLVLERFRAKNSGRILNVGSIASFFPGPLFASYYGCKAYVLRLSQAIAEELRREGSNVKISVLCPGPINTEFSDVAGMSFGVGKYKAAKLVVLESRDVAEYAVKKLLRGKEVIVPSPLMKLLVFVRHFASDKMLAKIVYSVQSMKFMKKDN